MDSKPPPILIVAWNRPTHARTVIEAVRAARPDSIFLAVDGPDELARPEDSSRIEQTIKSLESAIDWPCEVNRRYSEMNAGCRRGVASAIDWFFGAVESGIILEDDCVPSPAFFPYCARLLEKYKHDEQIMCISGDNSAHVQPSDGSDYSFVRYPQIWGWATWRRAWERYDRDLARYSSARQDGRWESLVPDSLERQTLERIFDRLVDEGRPDTWDYQWVATMLLDQGLSIHPSANLITNIGFGPDATHTRNPDNLRAGVPAVALFPFNYRKLAALDVEVSHQLFMATQVGQRPSTNSRPQGAKALLKSILQRTLARLPERMKAALRSVLIAWRVR